jgi:hypothetical protein
VAHGPMGRCLQNGLPNKRGVAEILHIVKGELSINI